MDQFRGGESLDTLNTVGFGNDDLKTWTVGFGTHLALDRLGAALEKIEHAVIIARPGVDRTCSAVLHSARRRRSHAEHAQGRRERREGCLRPFRQRRPAAGARRSRDPQTQTTQDSALLASVDLVTVGSRHARAAGRA